MLLQDQTVIVTGASRGIGKAIAVLLAREGATVVVNYAHSIERAENVVREIISAGGKAIAIKADVTLPEEVAAMIQSAVRQFGTIHGLVNEMG
jgi:3-oxoacyl-[acyl-carrier protein] reductase